MYYTIENKIKEICEEHKECCHNWKEGIRIPWLTISIPQKDGENYKCNIRCMPIDVCTPEGWKNFGRTCDKCNGKFPNTEEKMLKYFIENCAFA